MIEFQACPDYAKSGGFFRPAQVYISYWVFHIWGSPFDLESLLEALESVGQTSQLEQIAACTPEGQPATILLVRSREPLNAIPLDEGVLISGESSDLDELAAGVRRCIRQSQAGDKGYHEHHTTIPPHGTEPTAEILLGVICPNDPGSSQQEV